MKGTRRRPIAADTDVLSEWVGGLHADTAALPRVGCDDPEHEQWRARAELAEAERDQAAAERDAAQKQLAKHLSVSTRLPSLGIVWDEPIPEGARGTGDDWPDVPGDKAVGVPERIGGAE